MNLFRPICFLRVMCLVLLASIRAFAQPNSWTNNAGGNWEDASWSFGVLPSEFQDVVITNGNSKAITVSTTTAQNFPAAMTVNSLGLSAPPGETNTLSINSTGTNIFKVWQTVSVASNGVLAIADSSVLFWRDLLLSGVMSQVGGSVTFHHGSLYSAIDGRYFITNSFTDFFGPEVGRNGNGSIEQSGGTNLASVLILASGANRNGNYTLHNGTLNVNSGAPSYIGFNGIGNFTQYDGTITMNGPLQMGWNSTANGSYLLQAGTLSTPSLSLANQGSGSFIQNGGTNLIGGAMLLTPADYFRSAVYTLNDGLLQNSSVKVMPLPFSSLEDIEFIQNGGTHVTGGLTLGSTIFHRAYTLNGGTLKAGGISVLSIGFIYTQSGGIADISGNFTGVGFTDASGHRTSAGISGGTLKCSNLSFDLADFGISGGTVTVSNQISVTGVTPGYGGPPQNGVSVVSISGGSLTVSNIDAAGLFSINGPTEHMISQSGYFRLAKYLSVSSVNEKLGRLRVNGVWGFPNKLFFLGATNQLAFADSSAETWTTTLYVDGWKGSFSGGGAHQLFIGTNGNGITAAQLNQLKFVNLPGLPGTNSARILSTGEIVPFYQSTIYSQISQGSLILNWSNAVSLQTSTNVEGPYVDVSAISPYTNNFSEAQRFFRLRQ